jgi:hypothetical protein
MKPTVVVVGVFAAALLVAGCGGGDSGEPEAKSSSQPSQSAQTSQPAQPQGADSGWSDLKRPANMPEPQGKGSFTFVYEDADTPEAINGRKMMMDAKLLEGLTQNVNNILAVDREVAVKGKQCGQDNAFYNPTDQAFEMCYEMIDASYKRFQAANDPDPVKSAVDAEIAIFYHELGHATIDLYQLPFTGREEDVADQLSAVMLLAPGEDGKRDPEGVRIATDAARMWKLSAAENGDANKLPFYDVHAFDLQRWYNYECWIYGSDPAASGQIVSDDLLPKERAEGCQNEFDKMTEAWQQMLGPHFK